MLNPKPVKMLGKLYINQFMYNERFQRHRPKLIPSHSQWKFKICLHNIRILLCGYNRNEVEIVLYGSSLLMLI